ncbi:MAG: carbohydrate porin [Gammaproteobacteria bacterium]
MSLTSRYALALTVVGLLGAPQQSLAQGEGGSAADAKQTTSMISITDIQPILEPVNDYTGTFWQRSTLTGDWGGARQELLESGFAINGSLTQTFRVVAAGGADTGDTGYNALFDYGVTLDTAKLGLWPGGFIAVNAQSALESGLPLTDGAISPSDYNIVFPTLERPTTELMEYYLIQGLGETLAVMIGRVDPVAWDRNRFAFDPRTQFMNGALSQQLLVGGLVSFSTYTVAAMWQVSEHVNILGGIYDPEIEPGEFSTPFNEAGLFTVIELTSEHDGTVRLLGVYDMSEGIAFDNPRLVLDEVLGIAPDTKPNNWMFGINFEQYLWKPAHSSAVPVGTKDLEFATSSFGFQAPGLGVFGRVAFLPESRNAFSKSVSLGLGGRGLVPGRPLDRMGVGGYWLEASDALGGLAGRLLENEWGFEAFYNYAITPAIQASLDLQYSDSGIAANDDGFVVGMRLFTQF